MFHAHLHVTIAVTFTINGVLGEKALNVTEVSQVTIVVEEYHVSTPSVEVIEDVRRVDNGDLLLPQPVKEVHPYGEIERRRDLVEEDDSGRTHQLQKELHATALTI